MTRSATLCVQSALSRPRRTPSRYRRFWTRCALLVCLVALAPAWNPASRARAQNGCTSLIPPCPPNEGPYISIGLVSGAVQSASLTFGISASDDYALNPATLTLTATATTASVSPQFGSGNASMSGTVSLTLTTSPTTLIASIQVRISAMSITQFG